MKYDKFYNKFYTSSASSSILSQRLTAKIKGQGFTSLFKPYSSVVLRSLDCTPSMCLATHQPPDAADVHWVSATAATQRSNLRMDERGFLALRHKLENLVWLVGVSCGMKGLQ